MEMRRETILEDAAIIAFLALKDGITITPRKMPTGRVSFTVEGADVDRAIAELYSNIPVPIHDYIRALKNVRAIIFDMKGNGRNGHERKDHT